MNLMLNLTRSAQWHEQHTAPFGPTAGIDHTFKVTMHPVHDSRLSTCMPSTSPPPTDPCSMLRIYAQISGKNKLPNLTFTILSPCGKTLRFAAGPVADTTEATTRTALRLCMKHARELCEVYKILGMQV